MKNKKEKLVMVLLVVGLIVMTVAISYAAFRYTGTGTVLNQITTGSITMSYTESSNVISMTGALPTTDATGKVRLNEGEYFDFTVGSSITGTANINFEIAAQEVDGNTIDGSYIKYYLTKVNEDGSEEEVMAPTTYTAETSSNEYTGRPANMMSLYTGSMSSTTTTKYRLRLYVDESYNPQGDGGNLVYKVRVNVYGLSGDEIEEELAPGAYLYDGTYMDWETLKSEGYVTDTSVEETRLFERIGEVEVETFVIKEGITTIGSSAFDSCSSLKSVVIPASVTSIDKAAFAGCARIESIKINENNPVYDSRDNCVAIIETATNKLIKGFGNTVIPNTVEIIGESAFRYINVGVEITSIVIPSSVKTIEKYAFYEQRSLSNIVISEGVETIGDMAFAFCDRYLTTINIPSSIVSISNSAFSDCYLLTEVNYNGTKESWNALGFYNYYETTVHCTDGDIIMPSNAKE